MELWSAGRGTWTSQGKSTQAGSLLSPASQLTRKSSHHTTQQLFDIFTLTQHRDTYMQNIHRDTRYIEHIQTAYRVQVFHSSTNPFFFPFSTFSSQEPFQEESYANLSSLLHTLSLALHRNPTFWLQFPYILQNSAYSTCSACAVCSVSVGYI